MSIQEVGAPEVPVVIYNALVDEFGFDPLDNTLFTDLLPEVTLSVTNAAWYISADEPTIVNVPPEVFPAVEQDEQVAVTPFTDSDYAAEPTDAVAEAEDRVPIGFIAPDEDEAADGYAAPAVYLAVEETQPVESADADPVAAVAAEAEDAETPAETEATVAEDDLDVEMPEFVENLAAGLVDAEFEVPADYGVVLGDEVVQAQVEPATACDETREAINSHYIVLPE